MSRRSLAILIGLLGCGRDDGDPPLFPADYAATYQQVRNCRFSLEHDLVRMRVLASPDALGSYTGRTAPFPAGAIVLKEVYDSADTTCTGPILEYAVMQKLEAGSSPATLDWEWQEVDRNLRPAATNVMRCTQCHTGCGKPPEGFDGTCTVP